MAPLLETIMEFIPPLHPTAKDWLLSGALAPHLPAFIEKLRLGRYASLLEFLKTLTLCRALNHARYHSDNGRDAYWHMAIHNRGVFITLLMHRYA
jgi:hypothetical protein